MKSAAIVLGIIFLATTMVYSQENFTTIKFHETIHDFGKIHEENGPVTTTFTFVNTGKVPFKISKVKSSCGCTTPTYSKEPVKPGKKGFITAMYNPANVNGPFEKYITVSGNIKTPVNLIIKGTVIPKPTTILDKYPYVLGNLRFERKQILFGDAYDKSIDSLYFPVYNPSDKVITLKRIKAPVYLGTMDLPMKIKPREEKKILLLYNCQMKKDYGYLFDDIVLETDDELVPEKKFIAVINIIQDFKNMTPEELENTARIEFDRLSHDFGTVKEGKVLETTFWLRNTGKTRLTIYDIETTCGCTATTLGLRKLEPGESTQLKVVFHTKGRQGQQTKVIKIKTNDPYNQTVVLTITAFVVN